MPEFELESYHMVRYSIAMIIVGGLFLVGEFAAAIMWNFLLSVAVMLLGIVAVSIVGLLGWIHMNNVYERRIESIHRRST